MLRRVQEGTKERGVSCHQLSSQRRVRRQEGKRNAGGRREQVGKEASPVSNSLPCHLQPNLAFRLPWACGRRCHHHRPHHASRREPFVIVSPPLGRTVYRIQCGARWKPNPSDLPKPCASCWLTSRCLSCLRLLQGRHLLYQHVQLSPSLAARIKKVELVRRLSAIAPAATRG